MELFPDPRRLTDQEIEERVDRARELTGDFVSWSTIGLVREQQRRAAMTGHERIALTRFLAGPRRSPTPRTDIPFETPGVEP